MRNRENLILISIVFHFKAVLTQQKRQINFDLVYFLLMEDKKERETMESSLVIISVQS